MSDTLFSEKYSIIRVLDGTSGINYYIVQLRNNTEKMFIVNEFYDKSKISGAISEIIRLKQENKLLEFVEYFSENSKFYAVFEYSCKTSLKRYLELENLSFQYKVLLFKNILTAFIEYIDIPDIVRYSIIQPDNITIQNNSISFNYKLQFPENEITVKEKDVYNSAKNLLEAIFTKEQIQKNSKLCIIYDKCLKNIYTSIGEILKDLEDIMTELQKEISLKTIFEEKKKKYLALVLKIFEVAVIILALYMLYENFIKDDSISSSVHTPITAIGNVSLNSDKKEQQTETSDNVVYIDNNKIQEIEKETEKETEIFIEPETKDISQEEILQEETKQTEYKDEIYTVKQGDTMYSICLRYYKNSKYMDFIVKYNNISDKNIINIGQQIKIPSLEYIEQNIEEK